MCYIIDIDNLIFNLSKEKKMESFRFSDLIKSRLMLEKKISNVYFSVTKDALYRNISAYNGLISYSDGIIKVTNLPSSVIVNSNNSIPKEIRSKYIRTLKSITL